MIAINRNYPAASRSYGRTRTADEIKWLVCHYTGNATDLSRNNAIFFSELGSNTRSAGAHYFVDRGSIYSSVPDLRVAWSVGDSGTSTPGGRKYKGICTNYNSISIEMCSTGGRIHEETIGHTIDLVKHLMDLYGIDEDHVIRHFDVSGKICPGWAGWTGVSAPEWEHFKSLLHTPKVESTPVSTTSVGGLDMSCFPTVRNGSKGDHVKTVQMLLNGYGFSCGTVDGIAGKKTDEAIRKFQQNRLLTVDGIAGQKTLTKLFGL